MRPLAHRRRWRMWIGVSIVTAVSAVSAPAVPAAARLSTATTPTAHGLDPGIALEGSTARNVIVTGAPTVAEAVRAAGGVVTATLPIVHGVAATVPAGHVAALASDPRVGSVTADRAARFHDFIYDDTTSASQFVRTSQASDAWATGDLGQDVGVAVIDTGVSPMPDFTGRLVHGPDLSGEGTTIDSFGHGTVMAGIIAGDGRDSAERTGGAYTGVAPAAHIVAVKTAGANGVVDVSTMLQAMSWVAAYKDQFNIRVLNLSWGVASTQDPSIDPLDYAVERLWSDGIVVVVAAGNSGPSSGTITKPADDPVVMTVGAYNGHGDTDPRNDDVPRWSSRGPTAAGIAKPDLVAGGRSLVATRSFGSYVEENYPHALISPSYIKGSGTSEAAAVTAGVVALLLQARPELTPDQVKDVLMATASPIDGVSTLTQGAGRIQLTGALTATPTAPPQLLSATGLGSLEESRGGSHVTTDCNGVSTDIIGEIDVRCEPWDPQAWTAAPWNGDAWTGVSWKGAEWTGVSWKDVGWSEATWDGVSWKDGTWTSDSWQGSAPWNGGTADSSWAGVSWKGSTWTGVSWKDSLWSSSSWTTAEYDDEFLTAFWGSGPPRGRYLPGERFLPDAATEHREDPRG